MKNIRLLPVVVLAIAALLVLKTLGLVTNGSYVLTGTSLAQAAGAAAPSGGEGDATLAVPHEPTMEDTSPTLTDPSPTMSPQSEAAAGHAAPAEAAADHSAPADPAADHGATDPAADAGATAAEGAAADAGSAESSGVYCLESDAAIDASGNVIINPASAAAAAADGGAAAHEPAAADGSGDQMPIFAKSMTDCLPTGDAVPLLIDGKGGAVPLLTPDATSGTEQLLLERLAARRDELKKFEDDLTLRSSIVDAAEKRIAERASTLSALEAQISSLVDQRQEMETGQFAGIVAMYETMKPKDAASIFNSLDMEVLLRVAKAMSPRKMAPVLAAMDTARAQELTVKMAALPDSPPTEMSPADLATLPQIVGQ
ncbi:MAG: MotE family protein [Devosia sp.]